MGNWEIFIAIVEDMLDTKRKRHIIGGILMSTSLFFGGLAITTFTIKTEDKENA